jgi:hypothetical protein
VAGLLGGGTLLVVLLLAGTNLLQVAVSDARRQITALFERQRAVMSTAPERLVFDVGHVEWQRLRFNRETALRDNINLPTGDDYVPARIRWRGQTVPVRMRLKGVYSGHWSDERKWSFQVKVKGEHALLGMKAFSIQHPMNRDYLYEWLFLRALADEGLVALRFQFVDVAVNGEELGVYALAEHFGKHLIEANHFREGPIVGFDKDLLLAEYRRRNREGVEPYNVDGAFWAAPVEGIETGALEPGSREEEIHLKANSLLESFREGAAPGLVFDLEKMARAMALKALFGAYEFDWKDTKFYYNPITGRLEPIVAEVHHRPRLESPGWWIGDGGRPYMETFTRRFFDDPAFVGHYLAALRRMSDPGWLEALLARHEADLLSALDILHREFPEYRFDATVLAGLQRQLRSVLDPLNPARAYLDEASPERVVLEVASLQRWPLRLLAVRDAAGRRFRPAPGATVPGKRSQELARYHAVEFQREPGSGAPGAVDPEGLHLDFEIPGLVAPRETPVIRGPHVRRELMAEDPPRQAPDLAAIPFVRVREAERAIDLLPGRWVATRNVILPADYRVHATAGFHLDLRDGALLLSRSPLDWVGEEESPIVIESSDGTGQGLVVIGAGSASRLEWVVLRGLGAPRQGAWELTGAVTFYESDLELRHCRLERNTSGDDLINVIRARFAIEGSLFEHSLFDALDADFAEGHVHSSVFRRLGNDGVDVSGSRVELRDLVIEGAGDKALSVGEASELRGDGIHIVRASLGVAAKDGSEVSLGSLSLYDSRLGLAVFQKKPEFGPAHLAVAQLDQRGVEEPYEVETGSRLEVAGRKVADDATRVKARLYDAPGAAAPAPAPAPAGRP